MRINYVKATLDLGKLKLKCYLDTLFGANYYFSIDLKD